MTATSPAPPTHAFERATGVDALAEGRPSRGFTLTEVIVVLLIGGMLAALVVPVLGRMPSRVVIRKAGTDLQSAFTAASRRARATGATVFLRFDLEANQAEIVGEDSSPETLDEGPRSPDRELRFKLPNEIEWRYDGFDEPVFTFLPNGQAEGPRLQFSLRRRLFSLELDNLTGRVAIVEEQ